MICCDIVRLAATLPPTVCTLCVCMLACESVRVCVAPTSWLAVSFRYWLIDKACSTTLPTDRVRISPPSCLRWNVGASNCRDIYYRYRLLHSTDPRLGCVAHRNQNSLCLGFMLHLLETSPTQPELFHAASLRWDTRPLGADGVCWVKEQINEPVKINQLLSVLLQFRCHASAPSGIRAN